MSTKNPSKSPKNKLTHIKDISKSQILINWEKNPAFNLNIKPLHTCKDKIFISNDNSNNRIIHNQRNIKTKDYKLNMTINDILDKLEKHRNKNLSPKKDPYSKISDTLDKKAFDNSNNNCNQIISYKPTNNHKSVDDFFTDILNKNKELETKSSLFRYESDKFLIRSRNRRRSIYFPSEKPSRFPPLPPPPPALQIEKKKVNI